MFFLIPEKPIEILVGGLEHEFYDFPYIYIYWELLGGDWNHGILKETDWE